MIRDALRGLRRDALRVRSGREGAASPGLMIAIGLADPEEQAAASDPAAAPEHLENEVTDDELAALDENMGAEAPTAFPNDLVDDDDSSVGTTEPNDLRQRFRKR